jgi:glycosyltransferase involved in cell wall biosynthesis
VGIAKGMVILLAGFPKQGICVFYGHKSLPTADEVTHGGIIKFQRLNEVFPNRPRRFNILYMVSSNYPSDGIQLCRFAQRKGAKFVWNQDGVAYPAWMPSGWEESNARMAILLHEADYVFYQSEFARSSADEFLGKRSGPSEVLYNAVDTTLFCPPRIRKTSNELSLLVMGSQYHKYRLESSIRALACIRKARPRARMFVAGRVWDHVSGPIKQLIRDLRVEDFIEFMPPFTQKQAVGIFHKCDILLHTKIQDPCPGVVIEAMACGLPVVYSASGGVPELVGEAAGVGVPTETSWQNRTPPAPELWAEACLTVAEDLSRYSEAARQLAIERFDIRPWVERHKQVFSELLEN